MLASTGFGNETRLAHPQRHHGLAQGVIDLVGTGVRKILAFQQDPDAKLLRKSISTMEGCRSTDVRCQEFTRIRQGNAGSAHASLNAWSSSSRAGISVSGAKRPP